MFSLSKKVLSTHGPQYTRVLIEEYFDRAIRNKFIFSEAFLETSKKDKSLRVVIKSNPLLRRSFPTRYKITFEETDAGSEVIIKSGSLIWRLFVVLLGFAVFCIASPGALFLNNYFIEIALITAGISLLVFMSLLERNKVAKAIIESIK